MRSVFACAGGALLLSSPCLASDGPAVAASGLCAAQETTYFQCSAGKGRSINLCGPGEGAVQYRFGRNGKVELAYPADAKEGARSLRYAHYFRAQTDRYEVRFENEGVEYVLFDYQEGKRREAGVHVTGADGKESDVACSGPVRSQLPALKGVLRCDAESALNAGRCP
jgi:hypothetical protein